MVTDKKIYFASDFHLGVPNKQASLKREKLIVSWLDEVAKDAEVIYLVGDIFDFWFEYKHSIPKGFVRLQGKLAELVDRGIEIHVFTGNHDMWMFGYLVEEIGVIMHKKPMRAQHWNWQLEIGHGDGLGPGDHGYKMIKRIFASPLCQWAFERIHPNLGMGIAHFWSKRSRLSNKEPETFQGAENEWLVHYCNDKLKQEPTDFFVFGHRHVAIDYQLNDKSRYINLGEWIHQPTYGVLHQKGFELKRWPDNTSVPQS